MNTDAWFRFYEELNDFLPAARRKTAFPVRVDRKASVKDWIEALGIPHTEVDLVLVDGESADFTHVVRPGERIAVYPRFESLDIGPVTRVRSPPLRRLRFAVDANLGKLAALLRMLGFDTFYSPDTGDDKLAQLSKDEERELLTRDRGLLKRTEVERGYWVRATRPDAQLAEVVKRFDLGGALHPFSRCLRCNAPVQPVAAADVADRLPPAVRAHQQEYRRCPVCGRLYWPGSHYRHMQKLVDKIRRDGRGENHTD